MTKQIMIKLINIFGIHFPFVNNDNQSLRGIVISNHIFNNNASEQKQQLLPACTPSISKMLGMPMVYLFEMQNFIKKCNPEEDFSMVENLLCENVVLEKIIYFLKILF